MGLLVVFLIALNVAGLRDRMLNPGRAARIESLAVLPLENLSSDPDQDYFAEGMTDALIADLGNISALRVISRTSVMQYKNARRSLPEIARALNVDGLIEGSVTRQGDRVRITAQLFQTKPERRVWGETYERDLKDLLSLQREVARVIASEIRVNLTTQEQAHLATAVSINLEAHEAYLKGRYFWNKRTAEGLKKGLEYFNRATDKDPTYAAAYSGLADVYVGMGDYGLMPREEAYARSKAAAVKAVEMDDRLAEAHATLGSIAQFNWNWPEAQVEFRRAIELNPNYAPARQWYAGLLANLGQSDRAVAEARRARELDPLTPISSVDVGMVLYLAHRYKEAT